jgi:beta-mannosidase
MSSFATAQHSFDTTFFASEKLMSQNEVMLSINSVKGRSKVSVNGKVVMTIANEMIPHQTDVKPFLHKGNNQLSIRFDSLFIDTANFAIRYNILPNEPRVLLRMAQYNFGWDFCKQDLTPSFSGFDIIEQDLKAPIPYYVVTDSLKNDTAWMSLHIQSRKHHFLIANPKLWNANGTGQPFLYRLQAKDIGYRYAEQEICFGVRTIQLIEKEDSIGRSFYINLNNKPLFARGSNYIMTQQTDTTILQYAKSSHQNVIRVWGGSRYADEDFLTFCDNNGILVWQDFPFACALYPADSAFQSEVLIEANQALERLRRHPSVAILCGNNEIWEGINQWGWVSEVNDSVAMIESYNDLFKRLLPDVVSSVCPHIPYIHTSPSFGWGREESYRYGDSHYWGVWWADSTFEAFIRHTGRFVSEYGFQSPPSKSAIEAYETSLQLTDTLLYGDKTPNRYSKMQFHPRGFEIIARQIEDLYGGYEDLNDFLRKSNNVASAAYHIAINTHRRKKPICMGSLLWQFNEPNVAFSWSMIDGSQKPKAIYKTIERCFQPLILSLDTFTEPDSLLIYCCNDFYQAYNLPITNVVLYDNEGEMKFYRTYRNIHVDESSSSCVIRLAYSDISGFDRTTTYIQVTASAIEDAQTPNQQAETPKQHSLSAFGFFCKPKEYANPALYDSIMFE